MPQVVLRVRERFEKGSLEVASFGEGYQTIRCNSQEKTDLSRGSSGCNRICIVSYSVMPGEQQRGLRLVRIGLRA